MLLPTKPIIHSVQSRFPDNAPLGTGPVTFLNPCEPGQPACIDCITCLHAGQNCTICPNSNYENFCSDCTTSKDGCIITCSTCNLNPKSGPESDNTMARRKLAQKTAYYLTDATPLDLSQHGGTCRVDFCPSTAVGNETATINPQCVATDCQTDTHPICTGDDGLKFPDKGNYCFPGECDSRPLIGGRTRLCKYCLTVAALQLHFMLCHDGLAYACWCMSAQMKLPSGKLCEPLSPVVVPCNMVSISAHPDEDGQSLRHMHSRRLSKS